MAQAFKDLHPTYIRICCSKSLSRCTARKPRVPSGACSERPGRGNKTPQRLRNWLKWPVSVLVMENCHRVKQLEGLQKGYIYIYIHIVYVKAYYGKREMFIVMKVVLAAGYLHSIVVHSFGLEAIPMDISEHIDFRSHDLDDKSPNGWFFRCVSPRQIAQQHAQQMAMQAAQIAEVHAKLAVQQQVESMKARKETASCSHRKMCWNIDPK